MGEFGRDILCRDPEPLEQGKIYEYSHRPADLLAALGEIADREERRVAFDKSFPHRGSASAVSPVGVTVHSLSPPAKWITRAPGL